MKETRFDRLLRQANVPTPALDAWEARNMELPPPAVREERAMRRDVRTALSREIARKLGLSSNPNERVAAPMGWFFRARMLWRGGSLFLVVARSEVLGGCDEQTTYIEHAERVVDAHAIERWKSTLTMIGYPVKTKKTKATK